MSPPLSTLLAVILCLASSGLAAPVDIDHPVSIPLTRNFVNRDSTDGVADLSWVKTSTQKTINKYHATLSAFKVNTGGLLPGTTLDLDLNLGLGLGKRQSEALIDEQGGSFWQGSISIGTPAQTFNMDFDTGSSDLWVPTAQAGTGNVYTPSKSSTAADQKRTFQISYGDGSQTSGEVYTDKVTVAGLTATGQGVGAASNVSSTTGASFDGLVGMAYQSLSTEKTSPYFATLLSQGTVKDGRFSFALKTSGSALYLGGADSSKYTGSITYTPVTQKAYWQVNMGAAVVNGKNVATNTGAIIDTGTTLIYAPTSAASTFYSNYPGAVPLSTLGYSNYNGYYGVPCSGSSYVSLQFGGASWPISNAVFTEQGSVGTYNGKQYCLGGLIGSDSFGLGSSWLVGDVFLQNVYSVFDLANNRVGFAKLATSSGV